jgi:hypothetical protein
LSREELLDKAYELWFNFEKYNYSCSQSVVATMHRLLEIDDSLVRAATALSGGTANQRPAGAADWRFDGDGLFHRPSAGENVAR